MPDAADIASLPQDLLTEAFDVLPFGAAVFDAEERLVAVNDHYRGLMGAMGPKAVPGVAWHDLIAGCVACGALSAYSQYGKSWIEVAQEFRASHAPSCVLHKRDDGRIFEICYRPMPSGGFVLTRSDVTDRHTAQEQVAERERLLSVILETNPIPLVMARVSDGTIVYHSPAASQMLKSVTDARDGYHDPDAREEYIGLLRKHGRVDNFQVKRRVADGSIQTLSVAGALTDYDGELCVVSSVSNMTEILRREAMIRKVVEACPTPIIMNKARTGEILYRSPMVTELFGRAETTLGYWADPADRVAFIAALQARGELMSWRAQFKTTSGDVFYAAVSARIIQWSGEEIIVSHIRDLTRELAVEAELDRQRQQSFQNEKMMALGGLMAGVAHELNNPLSIVVGHAMMLQEEASDPDILRKTEKISNAAERCARIVKAFLTMAREEPMRLEEVDLNGVIETAIEVAQYDEAFHADVEVEIALATDLAAASCDADQITQVLINLLLNAVQAIGAGAGRVRVASAALPGHIQIVVEDDGPGVADELRARIFEPFFTTKGVGQGTGIGLAMCHRIVAAHGGTIRHDRPADGGARFTVMLPVGRALTEPFAPPMTTVSPRAAKVLVIDDEPDVADLNVEILVRGGYRAEVAYHAGEVRARLGDTRYDAVLSDLNMPGLDGRDLCEVIAALQPDLLPKTGFLTGDTMGEASRAFLAEIESPHIEKPVSPEELRAFVHRLVSGEG